MHKERKETTHVRVGEKHTSIYKANITIMYVKMVTGPIYKNNVSKREIKDKRYIKSSLHPSISTLPLTKISYTNFPLTMTNLITKTTPPFCHE